MKLFLIFFQSIFAFFYYQVEARGGRGGGRGGAAEDRETLIVD